jgi:hypothetical protein
VFFLAFARLRALAGGVDRVVDRAGALVGLRNRSLVYLAFAAVGALLGGSRRAGSPTRQAALLGALFSWSLRRR